MNLLWMEFYKLRHKKMSLLVIAISFMQFLFMMWFTKSMSVEECAEGWRSCLYTLLQLNCILMPLYIAMIASRLSDMEHKGSTLKCLKTIVPSHMIMHTKILCGGIYLMITVVLQVMVLLVISEVRSFSEAIPIGYLVYYGAITLLIDMTLFMLQLTLSLLLLNQMIAFMAAIAGTFLGLYSMFFSEDVAQWILWGYYALLSPVRMNWDSATHVVQFYWSAIPVGGIMRMIGILVGMCIVGTRLFMRKEN